MYQSIVVGYDESESSTAALKEASVRIKNHGGKLHLVHAVYFDKEEFTIMPSQLETRFADGTKLCRVAKAGIQEEFGLNGSVESLICEGEPPQVIVETADGSKADLIVLGTHGRRGLKRLLMGSVTSQVVLNAKCDVMIVKKACTKCSGSYHSILVPFDGSVSSEKALLKACSLAKIDGAEVTVLYVIPRYEEMMDFFKTDAVKKSLFLEGEKIVAAAKKLASDAGANIKAIVQEGHSSDKVIEIANAMKHDLIVMGTHGWRGVNKALMGSTAERVIALASCPVLIAK
jgi:nucleotide-binding universal stress UspA family protein